MLASLRREYGHFVTSGTQLLLLVVAVQLESRVGWLVCLGLMALVSLFAWFSALRRLRAVHDTPTSKIAGAAQGYVEVIGRGKPCSDPPLLSKFTALPCLWYRYHVERRDSRNNWHVEERGETDDPFVLEDDSGYCVVEPGGAEILTMHKDTWIRGDRRYTEWKLLNIDSLYVIGQFRTFGGSSVSVNADDEVKEVLTEWKEDMPELRKRFDLDEDGELDMQEWMLARQAAKREAAKRISALRAQPDINHLVQPQDGRLFLISNLPQSKLERRYWFWTWAHLTIFLGSLGGLGWIFGQNGYSIF
jgi:hypothetical protein